MTENQLKVVSFIAGGIVGAVGTKLLVERYVNNTYLLWNLISKIPRR